MIKNKKYNNGQYFTSNEYLKENVYKLIRNNSNIILEPSMGRGDLVDYIMKRKDIKFDLYEIDKTIKLLDTINKNNVIYGDFLKLSINKKYDTIIGNPPYIRTKKGNLYLDFIEKCYELLNDNGELIFIVPSDFLKLTSSKYIINKMIKNGTFTDIIHPNIETLFKNAYIDIIIFRYCKNNNLSNEIIVNNEKKYLINTDGILTFLNINNNNNLKFSDYFNIYVGMVSGKENVFKNEKLGNINILNGKNNINKYILIKKYPTNNEELNKYLLLHKNELINRKIRKFNNNNWFEWGALRNYKIITENIGKECIYIYNMSRQKNICFKGTVQYFGGNLLIMIPKKNINININKIIKYINSDDFKNNYLYSGRFKIGHKQLCNALFNIPSN